jgi:hypothetical protein
MKWLCPIEINIIIWKSTTRHFSSRRPRTSRKHAATTGAMETRPYCIRKDNSSDNRTHQVHTLVLPTFLYGSENWTLTASQRRRIEAAEMKLLRPLAGHTVNDHKTNDSIRRELQTECILDEIDEYRRNWLLHLQRIPQHRIPLKSYHYSPQGKRTVGRPKKRWREQL